LDHLIVVIKNSLNDVHFGCEGAKENTLDQFFTCENTLIEEQKKLIEKKIYFKNI
jgi:hypothetical protein